MDKLFDELCIHPFIGGGHRDEQNNNEQNEIEQKIRDLKTKLSCQESDIGDWKIAKCIEYSTPWDGVTL